MKKSEAFFATDAGKQMVAAELGLASLSDADADKVINGDISAPGTPQRNALFEKLERAERSSESTVQILVTMGTAVATGTAVGSGMDPGPVEQRTRKSGEASRQTLEENLREPMRRYMAYGYRDVSDADLKRVLSFLQSTAGKQYISAYLASLGPAFTPWAGAAASSSARACANWRWLSSRLKAPSRRNLFRQTPSLKGSAQA